MERVRLLQLYDTRDYEKIKRPFWKGVPPSPPAPLPQAGEGSHERRTDSLPDFPFY
jgi:hypothetical protein